MKWKLKLLKWFFANHKRWHRLVVQKLPAGIVMALELGETFNKDLGS